MEYVTPERFLERQFSPTEFVPFGGGNRRCIGMAFALFEMKLVLANVNMELADTQPVQPARKGALLGPGGGLKMIVKGNFLASGEPPVYIGFGSMRSANPENLTKLILAALNRTGQRGIILTGWGALSNTELPDNVFKIESIPHDWLFPKMAAVIHHGGSGTTAAGLRAGVPSVIVPFGSDQPFWGERVDDLGVGPAPILQRELTVERLATAIETVINDETMKARAKALGEKIRAEDGITKAIAIIENYESTYKNC